MRVIAGSARRLLLKAPEGRDTRPTTDRIKETLFNMLQPVLPGAVFVDLFSGSGAIGIEALIRENLAFTKLEDRAIVIKQDVCIALRGISEKADVIFLDPPYHCGHEKRVLEVLREIPWVTEETLILVEADLHTDFSWTESLGFTVEKEKRYKTNKHVFIRRGDLSEKNK